MSDEVTKKHCGCFVVMRSGKRYLFEPGDSSYVWGTVGNVCGVVVTEKGKVAFEAPLSEVSCVGGETWWFKDAWWGKE